MDVLIWPEEELFVSLTDETAAVVYSDGSGVVRQMRGFYGWDADLVTWFLSQPGYIRYGSTFVLLGVVLGLILRMRKARASA